MTSQTAAASPVSLNELRAMGRDLDDEKLIAILNLQPTAAELEEAVAWASGDGDVLAKRGRPMTGTVAAIVEILTSDEDDEPPPVR